MEGWGGRGCRMSETMQGVHVWVWRGWGVGVSVTVWCWWMISQWWTVLWLLLILCVSSSNDSGLRWRGSAVDVKSNDCRQMNAREPLWLGINPLAAGILRLTFPVFSSIQVFGQLYLFIRHHLGCRFQPNGCKNLEASRSVTERHRKWILFFSFVFFLFFFVAVK